MGRLRKLPVRTRVPSVVWAFAGLVTLFSLASSMTHISFAAEPLALVAIKFGDGCALCKPE